MIVPPKLAKRRDEFIQQWLRNNDWDYQKYRDRRPDRSAYDTLMNYEISALLEWAKEDAFNACWKELAPVVAAALQETQYRDGHYCSEELKQALKKIGVIDDQ